MKKGLSIILLISVLLSSFSFAAFAAEEIVYTTADPQFSKIGAGWAESTSERVAGPTGGTSWYVREKSSVGEFDASALNGSYGVYVFLTPYGATPDKIVLSVTASGKTTSYVTDGLHGGMSNRHWFFVGKHNFNGSDGDKVAMQIHENATEGSLRISGVKFIKNDTNTAAVETVDATASAPAAPSTGTAPAPSANGNEIIITTADAQFTKTGSGWGESTSERVAGPTGGSSLYVGNKDAVAQFDASSLNGSYGVYVYLTPYGGMADKVVVSVTSSGKTTPYVTDGMDGGMSNRHWLFLGNHAFNGSAEDKVTMQIHAEATEGNMRVSGVKFVKDDNTQSSSSATTTQPSATTPNTNSNEIIYTISDPQFKTTSKTKWGESTSERVAGPTNGPSLYVDNKAAIAEFDASALNGNYGVYVFVTPYGNSVADKVIVSVTASGATTPYVTDGMHGGMSNRHWLFVGKHNFNGSQGDKVTMQIHANATEGIMRVSGVKFVKDDTNTSPVETVDAEVVALPSEDAPQEIYYTTVPEIGSVLMGSSHPGFSLQGEFNESSLAMPVEDKAHYTYGNGASATWMPYLNKAENVEIFYFKPRNIPSEEPAAEIEVFAEGKATTTVVNFREPPTGWYSLGRYNFSGDGTEYVKITKKTVATDGPLRATCLKFAIYDPDSVEDSYVSAFQGTDLHIVERLGMLIGEGAGITEEYIKKVPTRVQAAIMILRLNGLDADAAAFTGTDNFSDAYLEEWALPYLAYLKAHPELGLIGTGENMFEPTANIDAQAYAKILLTALGYEYNVDFTWDGTLAFAAEKGIAVPAGAEFTVKDLAAMTASALNLNHKNGKKFLNKLIEERDGVADEGVYGIELPADLKAARDELRAQKRFIYNNDGNDVYSGYSYYPAPFDASHLDGTTINTENFLKRRSYGLEDTQVTTVTYCTGVFTSGHQESIGISDLRQRDWAYRLKEFTGKDSLTTMVDYVHSIGREIFWSMRMNDTHDLTYQEHELDPWKRDHLDLLMFRRDESAAKMIHGDNRWSAADYTHKEVRQLIYDVFEDILTRYDVDGIEFDFTRHPLYFKEVTQGIDVYPESVEKMNNLIRSLRDLTEQKSIEKGKPLLISVIVPDSIDFCYDIGLDLRTWCEEGLVDIVSLGSSHPGYFQDWKDSVKEYEAYDVLVHANLDGGTYSTALMDQFEIDKQEAAHAYAAGADGITLFNYFTPSHERFDVLGSAETCPAPDPNYFTQKRIASLNTIKNQDKYITIKR